MSLRGGSGSEITTVGARVIQSRRMTLTNATSGGEATNARPPVVENVVEAVIGLSVAAVEVVAMSVAAVRAASGGSLLHTMSQVTNKAVVRAGAGAKVKAGSLLTVNHSIVKSLTGIGMSVAEVGIKATVRRAGAPAIRMWRKETIQVDWRAQSTRRMERVLMSPHVMR